MEIVNQWLVMTTEGLQHLIETKRDGYYLFMNGQYSGISRANAESLLEQY